MADQQAAPSGVISRYRWYVLGLLLLVAVHNYVDRVSLHILQVQIGQEFRLTDSQLGLLTGLAFTLIYTVVSIPLGRLSDRGNRKMIILASLTVWSLMTLGCGMATGMISLAIMRMGVAVGEAGSLPPSHSLIADYFPVHERTLAIAIWSLCLPVGQAIGFGLSGWLGAEFGWRGAFLSVGAIGLIIAPLVLFALREPRTQTSDVEVHEPVPPLRESLRTLWSYPTLRHVVWGGALSAAVMGGFASWNAPFYYRVHGFSMRQLAGSLALLEGLGCGLGMILSGVLTERLSRRDARWRMRIPMLAALAVVPAMVVQFFVSDVYLSLGAGIVSFMLSSFYYPAVYASIQLMAPPRLRGLAAALSVLVLNAVGSTAPLLIGVISDHLMTRYGMVTDSLRYAIMAMALVTLWAAFHFRCAGRHLARDLARRETGDLPGCVPPSVA